MQVYNFKDKIKGDTFNGVKFSFSNPELDFSNVSVLVQFKKSKSNEKAVFSFSSAEGSITQTGNEFTMQPRELNYPAGVYYYDFQITFSNGVVKTFFEGTLKIVQDVSNDN